MSTANLQAKDPQLRKNESQKNIESDSSQSEISKKSQRKSSNRNSSQRSRSRKKRRSRSRETKKKHKNKHKSRRDRSRDSYRSKSRQRKRSKDRKKKQYDRGRDRERYRGRQYRDNRPPQYMVEQTLGPNQIPMPMIPGEGRRRQRSRSPLDYYRKNQNNNDGQFWDAFSWVPRINYTPNVSTSALANTKKMRRLMITKIPYQIGITQDNLRDLITRFMAQNYLKDQMNNCPVVNLQINQTDHNVAVELSSVEETCRMCRMEKIEIFKGFPNGIIRLGDSIYGNSILTQAQTAGQAQAAAFAAINVLENKKTNFTIDSSNNASGSSTLIRVTNAVTPYMATHLTSEQWEDYREDLIQGFSQYGKIVHSWFVKDEEKNICADAGNLFIEYEYKQNAQAAMSQMQGRMYDERIIKLYYWPRDLYYKNFRTDITPPVLPPPLKTTKQSK